MIKRLIRKVFRLGGGREPEVIPVVQHGITRDRISYGSRKVCESLQAGGFEAYVVGGAVRDLLLGHEPKDFDVATSATPDEVHRLVRRSRLIGRRFKLVHALFNDEVVEVSTFRSGEAAETDQHGRVLRDNVFGNRAQDAARRDFTLNALYYDPATETVLDFHKGVADLRKKTVRMIGDPAMRYREDPVRMLRAARLAAKTGFTIDERTRAPIQELAPLIHNVPAARLFDEMLKLLFSGHAVDCLKQLRGEGLHHGLLPLLDVIMEQPLGERFVWLSLASTDARVKAGKPTSPGFLFATLLWHEVLAAWEARKQNGELPFPALHAAMDEVLDLQAGKLAITRRIAADIKDIWVLQPRLENRAGRRPLRVLEQPRFRAGYDFLLLRAESGEVERELADWWTRFIDADGDSRLAMLTPEKKSVRRRRRRGKGKGDGAAAESEP